MSVTEFRVAVLILLGAALVVVSVDLSRIVNAVNDLSNKNRSCVVRAWNNSPVVATRWTCFKEK